MSCLTIIIKSENKQIRENTMEKIIFENEIYYFSKGIIYDDSFLEVPKKISQKILISYYKNIDYKLFEETDLLEHLKQLKTSGFYNDCLTAIEYGLNKFTASYDFYKTVFPIITSCHRALGEPQKAVDFWMENKSIFASCLSVPLLTSLAAAYCDVGNYELAKKCANKAYAIQGGSKNYQTELSLVFQRIKKETKDY